MTPDEQLRERTCALIREALPERAEQVRRDWTAIMASFCQSEIQQFHNFIYSHYLL